ncbi:aspartate kinase [Vibrio zhanjiangensis]|uniref:aspartate kinase n=1 Tax=Vibrio zhanjiangensis TaxID=1046128 RepID=A0ABQ6ETN3_9VIBR|nr:aspartate kinase [Vibrio zhanjiangensis]GLT16416.1 aspartate kinase [Vibrio zhanjiangensis]
MSHRVEKVGGSSMIAFDSVLKNIILRPKEKSLYNRIVVVTAYQGITDALLESTNSRELGVYQRILCGDNSWEAALASITQRLLLLNDNLFADPILRIQADDFIQDRVSQTRQWIHEHLSNMHLDTIVHEDSSALIRERLASIGEAHSAFNTVLKAKRYGVKARFLDLLGAPEKPRGPLDKQIKTSLEELNLDNELPVVAGCASNSTIDSFQTDRRYGDLTLSKIAVLTKAKQAIIYKPHHLSTGDPDLVGVDHSSPLGQSNYQVAQEIVSLTNDVVHPSAIKELSNQDINLNVKCTFDPEHPGTVISNNYQSEDNHIDVITGKQDVYALKVEINDCSQYLDKLFALLATSNINMLYSDMKGRILSSYFNCLPAESGLVLGKVKKLLPDVEVSIQKVALISVIGTNIMANRSLHLGCSALEKQGIVPDAIHICGNDSSIKFVVACSQYRASTCALHHAFFQ